MIKMNSTEPIMESEDGLRVNSKCDGVDTPTFVNQQRETLGGFGEGDNQTFDTCSIETNSDNVDNVDSKSTIENDVDPFPLHENAHQHTTGPKNENDRIQQLILNAKNTRSVTVDLRGQGLETLPLEILELSDLQYLYLEGNQLTSLPDNFFDCLTELRWLDLRRNYLSHLPSTYIGAHKHLQSLLLEGNELKTLPLELSLIPTLHGLNIHNNPLEFPPAEIIERGTQGVLQFMRDLIKAKSHGALDSDADYTQYLNLDLTGGGLKIENLAIGSDDEYSDFDDYNQNASDGSKTNSQQTNSKGSSLSETDFTSPNYISAELQKPLAKKNKPKFRRDANSVEKAKMAGHDKRSVKANMYPKPPPTDRVKQRFVAEQHQFSEQKLNEQENLIIQKRKNQEQLRQWRQDGRTLQQDRYLEAQIYGGAKDPVDIAEMAPYDVEKEHMRMQTNEERIAQAVKESHEKITKRRPMSPNSVAKMEAERLARDKDLERRIKSHMETMHHRRRKQKGTPQEEMDASRKELEIASQLQHEIEDRRKSLEHRFVTFKS